MRQIAYIILFLLVKIPILLSYEGVGIVWQMHPDDHIKKSANEFEIYYQSLDIEMSESLKPNSTLNDFRSLLL